jgi:hypothetical protein
MHDATVHLQRMSKKNGKMKENHKGRWKILFFWWICHALVGGSARVYVNAIPHSLAAEIISNKLFIYDTIYAIAFSKLTYQILLQIQMNIEVLRKLMCQHYYQ